MPIETLAVKRVLQYRDVNFIDRVKKDMVKQLSDEILKMVSFETQLDGIIGNMVIPAKLRIVNNK